MNRYTKVHHFSAKVKKQEISLSIFSIFGTAIALNLLMAVIFLPTSNEKFYLFIDGVSPEMSIIRPNTLLISSVELSVKY